jgi:O-antigen/teichoic acid export membrane protein
MAEEQEILEKSVAFTVLKYCSYFVLIVTGFAVTKYLGPAAFGVYAAMLLILKYSTYSFMGFYSACFKKLSFLRGRGAYEKLQDIRDNTFAPSFLLTLAIGIIIFAGSFLFSESMVANALRLVAAIVVLQQMYYFYNIFLRCDKEFAFFGTVDLIFSVVRLVVILLFLNQLTVGWVLLAVISGYVVALLFGLAFHPYTLRLGFRFRESRSLFSFGVPNTSLGALDSLLTSVDKLMIIRFYDRVALGLYSFAVLVIELITFIPTNISMVLLPSQVERVGRNSAPERLRNLFYMPMLIISYLLPILMGGAFLFSGDVMRWLFPQYIDAMPALFFLVMGAYFLSNTYLVENFIVSLNLEKSILLPKALAIGLSFLLTYGAVRMGYGLAGIALATTIAYACYLIYVTRYALRLHTPDSWLTDIVILFVPIPVLLGLVYLVQWLPFSGSSVASTLLIDGIRYALFLLGNVPLWYYLNRRTRLFSLAWQNILQRLGRRRQDLNSSTRRLPP